MRLLLISLATFGFIVCAFTTVLLGILLSFQLKQKRYLFMHSPFNLFRPELWKPGTAPLRRAVMISAGLTFAFWAIAFIAQELGR